MALGEASSIRPMRRLSPPRRCRAAVRGVGDAGPLTTLPSLPATDASNSRRAAAWQPRRVEHCKHSGRARSGRCAGRLATSWSPNFQLARTKTMPPCSTRWPMGRTFPESVTRSAHHRRGAGARPRRQAVRAGSREADRGVQCAKGSSPRAQDASGPHRRGKAGFGRRVPVC